MCFFAHQTFIFSVSHRAAGIAAVDANDNRNSKQVDPLAPEFFLSGIGPIGEDVADHLRSTKLAK